MLGPAAPIAIAPTVKSATLTATNEPFFDVVIALSPFIGKWIKHTLISPILGRLPSGADTDSGGLTPVLCSSDSYTFGPRL